MDPDVKRLFEELAQLNRDMLNRFDLSWTAIDRRLDAQTQQMLAQAAAMRDMRDEIKANTQGLLRVFDRLDGLEGSA
ncbi:MAG TPA: hypothetical protein VF712_03550 [Thermoleophilaceae bacterium]